jgi:Guanine nucleotide exchange factor synembryn
MLLKPATRQMFVDLKYESKVCNRLKHDSRDDEFLVSRIIFLTTYNTNVNIEELIDKYHLAENINQNIIRYAACCDEKKKKKPNEDPMQDMALTETLKLVFNLSHFCPQRSGSFTPAISHIITILHRRPVSSSQPLQPPIGPLVNSLINLDLKNDDIIHTLFPKNEQNAITERLTELLHLTVRVYKEEELEQQASPLVILVRRVYELAPKDVKAFMRSHILPSDDDRQRPLGRSDTLSSKLLMLSTSPLAPKLREEISNLLFEMSNRDARTYVQNVGYGFASGFLFQHNVPIPENALEAWSTGEIDARSSTSSNRRNINPITGQKTEFEPKFEGPEMTKGEKEREAEKLFVLFERYTGSHPPSHEV